VACVPGSGVSFLDAIARADVDCLVTGDFKHHDALKARALGVSVVDVTHSPTERATTKMLADALASTCEIRVSQAPMNPFEAL
jgi:putative NIF3 family GTP cyclohydrolase 1 type 2